MSQNIEILFQDEDFIFVNKPSGVPVHRSRECSDVESLVQILRRQVGFSIFPIHRLDRGVSGVIGFGKSSESARKLQVFLDHEQTKKMYIALVRGKTPLEFSVNKDLTNDAGVVQVAKTEFTTLVNHNFCSLVKARIFTGRKHQIRRHLSHLTFHILGDRSYGKGRLNKFYQERYSLNRIFLHALEMHLFDIDSHKVRIIRAPLPIDLREVLSQLTREGLFDMQKIQELL